MPRYSDSRIAEALKAAHGMPFVAARKLGASPTTVIARIKKSKMLTELKQAEREFFLDTAEMKLMQSVEDGELGAIKYALSTIGRERGYTERATLEHTGAGGGPILIKSIEVVRDAGSEKTGDTS